MITRLVNRARKTLGINFVRYLIVGFSSFGLDFLIFNTLIFVFSVAPLSANVISLLISLVFNFLASNYWTFKAGGKKKKQKLFRYVSIASFNYVMNNAILGFLLYVVFLNPVPAKIVVTGLQVSWTFLVYKLWVFKTPEKQDAEAIQDALI